MSTENVKHTLMPYLKNLGTVSCVQGRLPFLILAKQTGMSVQQIPETVFVPPLRAEVAGRVPINVLRVDVGARHQHRLYNAQVPTQTRHVQGCAEVACPCVDVCTVLHKELD